MMMSDEKIGLAARLNRVPDHPGYIYGLAVRDGERVKVDVTTPNAETLHVEGIGWAGAEGIHAVAQRMIEEYEAKRA